MSKHIIIWHSNIKDDDNIKIYSQDPSYVVSADRTDLVNLKKIDEVHKPGIYILSDKFNNRYVGQASHSVLSRLLEHDKKKPWWDSILFFGRDDGKLDKSQLDYLEKKLIKLYADAGFVLDNGDVGNKSFIEAYQRGKAESLWENTLQILEDSANIQLFKKARISVNSSSLTKTDADAVIAVSGHQLALTQRKTLYELTDSLGHKIEAKSVRKLYIGWIKLLVNNDGYKSIFYSMLSEGSAIFKAEEIIGKKNDRWTEKLDEGLYLMVHLSAKDIYRRIEKIAERLDIKVKAE